MITVLYIRITDKPDSGRKLHSTSKSRCKTFFPSDILIRLKGSFSTFWVIRLVRPSIPITLPFWSVFYDNYLSSASSNKRLILDVAWGHYRLKKEINRNLTCLSNDNSMHTARGSWCVPIVTKNVFENVFVVCFCCCLLSLLLLFT